MDGEIISNNAIITTPSGVFLTHDTSKSRGVGVTWCSSAIRDNFRWMMKPDDTLSFPARFKSWTFSDAQSRHLQRVHSLINTSERVMAISWQGSRHVFDGYRWSSCKRERHGRRHKSVRDLSSRVWEVTTPALRCRWEWSKTDRSCYENGDG